MTVNHRLDATGRSQAGFFYALGAYSKAVLMRHAGVSAYAGILAAALVCLVLTLAAIVYTVISALPYIR